MRLTLFLVLVVATFAVLVSAEKTTTSRRLKGTDDLTAEEEERDNLATKAQGLVSGVEKVSNPAVIAKWQNALKKIQNPAALNKVDDAAAGAAGAAGKVSNAAVAAKWQNAMKNLKNLDKIDDAAAGATGAATGAAKNWQKLAKAVESGAHLKKVDTSTSRWKTAFAKVKENPQLASITETQAVKMTEVAAKEVAKNPSKWRYVKKFLEIAFGAALTALMVVGFNSMT